MIEIQYELREKDILALNDHQLKSSDHFRKTLNRHQATIPAMLGLIAVFVWFYYQDSLSAGWIAVMACAWGLGAPLYLKWSVRRKILNMYSAEDKARILGDYTLRIEPAELVVIRGEEASPVKWSEVLRIEAGKNYAFLFVTADLVFIIPSASVKHGDIREFFDEAEKRIEAAA